MKILMVCAGNICRSPLAEGIMQHYIDLHGLDWTVDSAGTESYHIGNPPDDRSVDVAQQYGIDITQQRARQVCLADFDAFDVVYVMDTHNYNEIIRKWLERDKTYNNEKYRNKVKFILNEVYQNQNRIVPDPYYGGKKGFETVYALLNEACQVIVERYSKR